ncbi:MAG: hypothetical protein LBT65_06965 [Synergistaceae bacterium]|jgi:hypothetical protein|nr:hypothetical protein [Synergistaceae bacterium]
MNIAVFDLETNGMRGSSVLSASSLVFDAKGALLSLFNRVYVPHEPYDSRAARIHGLTPARVAALRLAIPAPLHFLEDWPDLLNLWDDFDVAGVVVHNLAFDTAFLPEFAQRFFKWWCSMRGLTAYCAIPARPGNARGRGEGRFKWPRLSEAVDILCEGPRSMDVPDAAARIEGAVNDLHPHISLCDCFDLYRVVVRVAYRHPELLNFAPHVIHFCPPSEGEPVVQDFQTPPRRDRFTIGILEYEQKLRSVI